MTTDRKQGLLSPPLSLTHITCMRMPSSSTVKTVSSRKERLEGPSKLSGETETKPKRPMRLIRKGRWAGMTAVTIAELMGCSAWTAKQWLYKVRPVDLEEVGRLVYNYRNEKDRRSLGHLLDWSSRRM